MGTLESTAGGSDFQAAFDAGSATKVISTVIEGVPHVLVPPGSSLKSMETLLPAPQRIVASPEFHSVEGFLDYTEEFAQDGTRIFVDKGQWRFFTIFDSHAPNAPAWGDHCASLTLNLSPEWRLFKRIDGDRMSPQELAELLEENLAYFVGPLEGAELLTMAQNLKVDLKGDLQINSSTQSGLRLLSIRDDSTVAGRSGEKELAFPEKVELKLRIFDNHHAYPISVFLRYRASKEGVRFWFKIPDPDGIEEEAFTQAVDEIRDKSGLRTLHGKYQGPRHK